MIDSVFTDLQVDGVRGRHLARKIKRLWDGSDQRSSIEDMENILEELRRTNGMVEILRQRLQEAGQSVLTLLPRSPEAK
jgi:hypothetical protein